MATLALTDIDDAVFQSIRLRAEATGRSVQDVAREALERGLLVDIDGRVAAADRVRAMTPKPIEDDSTDIIRRLRDAS